MDDWSDLKTILRHFKSQHNCDSTLLRVKDKVRNLGRPVRDGRSEEKDTISRDGDCQLL